MKKAKNWDIFAVILAGVFFCSTTLLSALLYNSNQKGASYKSRYEDTVQQYNELLGKYQEACSALEEAGSSSGNSTRKLLENGNFVAGEDFPAGTYDIEAVSGFGNVYSDNLFGGINAIMGVPSEDPSGIAEKKYSNISLPEGTTLTVRDVKVRITLVDE